MSELRFSRGATARLTLSLISAGTGVTGQSPVVAIQRVNSQWFKASDASWQVAPFDNPMVATDATNLPGHYRFDFDQSKDLEIESTVYTARIKNSTNYLEYRDLVAGPLTYTTEPDLCAITGTVVSMSGERVKNAQVRATLVPVFVDIFGRGVEANRVVKTYTNESGDFSLSLVRGTTVRFEVEAIGYDRKFLVPNASSAILVDL